MTQNTIKNTRAHYRVQLANVPYLPTLPLTGTYYGVNFVNGFAYVNWQTLGEWESYQAIQALGSDARFTVTEINERVYRDESEAKKSYPL